ncbi:MAG TPA: amino acid ABC transporter ATP-binding protein, partial [Thermoplasmata archaeon]|nr:amino acid ABC transporter ATP-binding protein [Thermoplasmata archaeon]
MSKGTRDVTQLAAVSFEHVWAGYGKHDILKDVSFSIQEGEFLGIIGPNGG